MKKKRKQFHPGFVCSRCSARYVFTQTHGIRGARYMKDEWVCGSCLTVDERAVPVISKARK